MRNPVLPALMLTVLAAALYFLPDGAMYGWRLAVRGAVARLFRPPDPRRDAVGEIYSDRRDLLEVLQQKDARIADLDRRLRELGVITDQVERVRIVPARVIRLGPDNTLDTFTIDAGSRAGVRPGQAVAVGRAIAGVVVRSEAEASLVLSLASPGCYISARLGEEEPTPDRPRILCAVKGTGAGEVAAVIFSTATAAKEGWLATTSGLEKSIPEGLFLGTLTGRPVEGEENGTLEIAMKPAADLPSLDFVAVLARE